jgi:hypothetical protein
MIAPTTRVTLRNPTPAWVKLAAQVAFGVGERIMPWTELINGEHWPIRSAENSTGFSLVKTIAILFEQIAVSPIAIGSNSVAIPPFGTASRRSGDLSLSHRPSSTAIHGGHVVKQRYTECS